MDREIKKAPNKLGEILQFIRMYFRDSRGEITSINMASMKTAGYGGLAMLLAFNIITPMIFTDWHPAIEYWMMVPVLGAFGIFASIYGRVKRQNYYVVQCACLLFYVLLVLGCFRQYRACSRTP